MAHILMDRFFRSANLPLEYPRRLRHVKQAPVYSEIITLLKRLYSVESSDYFRTFIKKYTEIAPEDNSSNQYWGGVREAVNSLSDTWDTLVSFKYPLHQFLHPDQMGVNNRAAKAIHKMAAKIKNIIPNKVCEIFHLDIEKITWNQPTEKEINVLIYMSGHGDFLKKDHPLNQALRSYYQSRLTGGTRDQALAAYRRQLSSVDGMKAQMDTLKPFLIKDRTRLSSPPALKGVVMSGQVDLQAKALWENWYAAIQHLRELADVVAADQMNLHDRSFINDLIAQDRAFTTEELTGDIPEIMETLKHLGSTIPKELYNVIKTHLEEVSGLLMQKSGEMPLRSSRSDLSPKNVEIYMEQDPLEILHLGWPRLGGSCLDITGIYNQYAAGYLLNLTAGVLYIRDIQNPSRPLARVSVMLDPETGTLFTVSPIKTSNPYNYVPIVREYLKTWAETGNLDVIEAVKLEDETADLVKKRKEVTLSKSLAPFYSDLTGMVNLTEKTRRIEIEGIAHQANKNTKFWHKILNWFSELWNDNSDDAAPIPRYAATTGAFGLWEIIKVPKLLAGGIEGFIAGWQFLELYLHPTIFMNGYLTGIPLVDAILMVVGTFFMGHLLLGVYGKRPKHLMEHLKNTWKATSIASLTSLAAPVLLALAASGNILSPAGVVFAIFSMLVIIFSAFFHGEMNRSITDNVLMEVDLEKPDGIGAKTAKIIKSRPDSDDSLFTPGLLELFNKGMLRLFKSDKPLYWSIGQRSIPQKFKIITYDMELLPFIFNMFLGRFIQPDETPAFPLPRSLLTAYNSTHGYRQKTAKRIITWSINTIIRKRDNPNFMDRGLFLFLAFLQQPEAFWQSVIVPHLDKSDPLYPAVSALQKQVFQSQSITDGSDARILEKCYATLLDKRYFSKDDQVKSALQKRLELLEKMKSLRFGIITVRDNDGHTFNLPIPHNKRLARAVILRLRRWGVIKKRPGRPLFQRMQRGGSSV